MEVLTLSKLPVEILSHILSFGISHCALDLWKCGNRALNALLLNGGAREIELMDTSWVGETRWPLVLSEFRNLRSLTIYRPQAMIDDINFVRDALKQLTVTLETLNLSFIGSVWVLMQPEAIMVEHRSTMSTDGSTIQSYKV
jgi:hypothetical protein